MRICPVVYTYRVYRCLALIWEYAFSKDRLPAHLCSTVRFNLEGDQQIQIGFQGWSG